MIGNGPVFHNELDRRSGKREQRCARAHLNDLKKENFSLKLRIYFLEERIQQKFEDSSDDIYRTNIELKVEVESLKQELQEKQQLLDKALYVHLPDQSTYISTLAFFCLCGCGNERDRTTAESLTNHNEAELQRRCGERQQEIDHMQQLARNEAERMASLAESHSQHPSVAMETVPKETSGDSSPQPDEDADRERIEQLSAALCCKERLIQELTEERTDLRQRVRLMEEQLQQLSASLLQKERDVQFYQEELGRERLRVQQEMQVSVCNSLQAGEIDQGWS
ncbi:Myomegalin [Anabarilius grahami]|uniref:Myomegalin n=1 Tax=Anabarilius grahami TaxID=495550 RepID=A0A3N0YZ47_ANAGA|nr:Myomegalin [Anabarilius grahami]